MASSQSCVTHVGSPGGHEDGEVREVVAGAGGGVGAHVHGPAAPGGPAALQAVGLVLPESTFDAVVLGVHGLRRRRGKKGGDANKRKTTCRLL